MRTRNKRAKTSFFCCLGRAWRSLTYCPAVTLTTIGVCTLSFLMLAAYLALCQNLQHQAQRWGEKVQVTAYLADEPQSQQLDRLMSQVKAVAGTAKVVYVSRLQAEERLRSRLKGQEFLLEGMSRSALPASLEIGLDASHRDDTSVARFAAVVQKIPGVAEVQYGERLLQRFNRLMSIGGVVLELGAAFLVLAVTYIAGNCIKLTIHARRDELQLTRLLGGSREFVMLPVMAEGLIQGVAGAVLAIGLLAVTYGALLYNDSGFGVLQSQLLFLSWPAQVGLVIIGAVAGVTGAGVALARLSR